MSEHPYIIHGSEENFIDAVITASHTQPVLVDFWADWCAPCKALMPVLEKLAQEYAGAFLLVKVNADEQQALAAQFGVRSLPTVKLFNAGQPVDEFMGALPENDIKAFLDKHLDNPLDVLANNAITALMSGKQAEAQPLFEQVFAAHPTHLASLLALASHAVDAQKFDDAEKFLQQINPSDHTQAEVVQLKAKLEMAKNLEGVDISQLEATVNTAPDDLKSRIALGNAYVASGHYSAGLDQFLLVVQKDRHFNNDAGRSAAINVFNLLGSQHPVVKDYRRKLATLLN